MEAIIRGRNYMIIIELTNTETFQMVNGRPFPMFAIATIYPPQSIWYLG